MWSWRREAGRATYRDVLDAPAHMGAETVEGALHLQPRPAGRHRLAGSSPGGELVSPFQKGRGGPGGWWILDEPELHFGGDVLVPDLAGWRRERIACGSGYALLHARAGPGVRSAFPFDAEVRPRGKRPVYAREGVGHLRLVDPAARTLEAFALANGDRSPAGSARNDDTVSLPPFDSPSTPSGPKARRPASSFRCSGRRMRGSLRCSTSRESMNWCERSQQFARPQRGESGRRQPGTTEAQLVPDRSRDRDFTFIVPEAPDDTGARPRPQRLRDGIGVQ